MPKPNQASRNNNDIQHLKDSLETRIRKKLDDWAYAGGVNRRNLSSSVHWPALRKAVIEIVQAELNRDRESITEHV